MKRMLGIACGLTLAVGVMVLWCAFWLRYLPKLIGVICWALTLYMNLMFKAPSSLCLPLLAFLCGVFVLAFMNGYGRKDLALLVPALPPRRLRRTGSALVALLACVFASQAAFASPSAPAPAAYRLLRPMPLKTFAAAMASRSGTDVAVEGKVGESLVMPQGFADPRPEHMVAAAAVQAGAAFTNAGGAWSITKPELRQTAVAATQKTPRAENAVTAASRLSEPSAKAPASPGQATEAKPRSKPTATHKPKRQEKPLTEAEIRKQIKALEAQKKKLEASQKRQKRSGWF